MQGLLRGRFTLGTTHSKPTTPKDTKTVRLTLSLNCTDFISNPKLHPLSSSVLSSKAGLSRPASCVHTGPLLMVLLSLEGGDGVSSLRSVCGEMGDLGVLLTVARSSPLSQRVPSVLVCWHRIPGHLSSSDRCQFVSP